MAHEDMDVDAAAAAATASTSGRAGVTFCLENEDHTLANALRYFLNKNPYVELCGYSMPHPSEEVVNVRVQTLGGATPKQALRKACDDVQQVCSHVDATMDRALEEFRARQSS